MFVRLTRRKRVKAGWFAALLYLFCVLAPGVALAAGDAASCLVHQFEMATADAGHTMPGHTEQRHDDKGSPEPCCAMLCLSAIAADLPSIAKPVQPISLCVAENFQRRPDKAPSLLYRPPIA
jgi:hypothetical protein